MMSRLSLVGYRACGKSTVGRLVAHHLHWSFVDVDTALEKNLGMPISAYFSLHGESAFRDQEETVLAHLLGTPEPRILATGGGAIIRPQNRERLRTHGGLVVWLKADPEVVQNRLRHDLGNRPSLSGASPVDEAPRIMAEREAWYREVASVILDASLSPEILAQDLIARLT